MILEVFLLLALFEILLFSLISFLRKDFQWLIIHKDKSVNISRSVAEKFMKESFHPKLGWMKKPNSKFDDITENGRAIYNISPDGTRKNELYGTRKSKITSYGDSFCFGRLVDDNQTWQFFLSEKINHNVSNRGVGNYGLDQALLRFEMELDSLSCKYVIINVVPETIARIRSVWKHYFEYGNTLAFKPHFRLYQGKLSLSDCPVQNADQLVATAKSPSRIEKKDYFYTKKFSKDIMRFPFVITIFKRPLRNLKLITLIISDKIIRLINGDEKSRAFGAILRENKRWVQKLYDEDESQELLYAILLRFRDLSKSRNIHPILLWTPQKVDLEQRFINSYRCFLDRLTHMQIDFVDMTDEFLKHKEKVYINGNLGPHPSAFANKLTASVLHEKLIDIDEKDFS